MPTGSDILLYHHPFSRAANVVWMLEEVGMPYTLRYVDIAQGEGHQDDVHRLNPMGKLPTLVDGDAVITESAAIGVYLADRYAGGRLAPAIDDPARGVYLRWSFFAPSVIEPGAYAKQAGWDFRPGAAGWGRYDDMLDSIEHAIGGGPFLLGERFSMADVIFGGTLRYMLMFKMLDPRPSFTAYVDRLNTRPASQRARAKNDAVVAERGLGG